MGFLLSRLGGVFFGVSVAGTFGRDLWMGALLGWGFVMALQFTAEYVMEKFGFEMRK